MKFNIESLDITDSTNTYLYKKGLQGIDEGYVVTAKTQSNGRGRNGREFVSPTGNLYMSILIRPSVKADELHLLTPMCAVCVVDAIKDVFGISCKIKWVNDIYHKDKKVCGILTELGMTQTMVDFVVIGIGVNVFPVEFENGLSEIAGCILDEEDLDDRVDRESVLAQFIDSILKHFNDYYSEFDNHSFMTSYRSESLVIGKTVKYETKSIIETVEVLDISENGELIVKNSRGEVETYCGGEIRIKI